MTIPLHRWDDVPQPRAAVQIVHGMSEHGARYARLAARLNDARVVAWAHDHRGHGLNPTPPVGLGHFADTGGWRALVDDAAAVTAQMRAAFPGLPLVLFAHSMGSFVAQYLMSEHGANYCGVILSGSNGSPGPQERLLRWGARGVRLAIGGRRPAARFSAVVFGAYNRRFAPTRTPFDWLSRDVAEVDRYAQDPLCGFPLTAQAWVDLLDARPGLDAAAFLDRIPKDLPVRVISGSRDPVGEDLRGVERLLRSFAGAHLSRVSHRFYRDARHELVNEVNRDEVTREVIDWIGRILPPAAA